MLVLPTTAVCKPRRSKTPKEAKRTCIHNIVFGLYSTALPQTPQSSPCLEHAGFSLVGQSVAETVWAVLNWPSTSWNRVDNGALVAGHPATCVCWPWLVTMTLLESFSFWCCERLISCDIHLRGDQMHKFCCGKGFLMMLILSWKIVSWILIQGIRGKCVGLALCWNGPLQNQVGMPKTRVSEPRDVLLRQDVTVYLIHLLLVLPLQPITDALRKRVTLWKCTEINPRLLELKWEKTREHQRVSV